MVQIGLFDRDDDCDVEQPSSLYCPYCDGRQVKLRDTVSTLEKGDTIIVAKRVVCRECGETSYAVRVFRSEPQAYECVRREDLEPRTGIRASRSGAVKRRWCRWSPC